MLKPEKAILSGHSHSNILDVLCVRKEKKITLMMSDDRQRLISPFYFPLVYFVWFKAYNYIFTHHTTPHTHSMPMPPAILPLLFFSYFLYA